MDEKTLHGEPDTLIPSCTAVVDAVDIEKSTLTGQSAEPDVEGTAVAITETRPSVRVLTGRGGEFDFVTIRPEQDGLQLQQDPNHSNTTSKKRKRRVRYRRNKRTLPLQTGGGGTRSGNDEHSAAEATTTDEAGEGTDDGSSELDNNNSSREKEGITEHVVKINPCPAWDSNAESDQIPLKEEMHFDLQTSTSGVVNGDQDHATAVQDVDTGLVSSLHFEFPKSEVITTNDDAGTDDGSFKLDNNNINSCLEEEQEEIEAHVMDVNPNDHIWDFDAESVATIKQIPLKEEKNFELQTRRSRTRSGIVTSNDDDDFPVVEIDAGIVSSFNFELPSSFQSNMAVFTSTPIQEKIIEPEKDSEIVPRFDFSTWTLPPLQFQQIGGGGKKFLNDNISTKATTNEETETVDGSPKLVKYNSESVPTQLEEEDEKHLKISSSTSTGGIAISNHDHPIVLIDAGIVSSYHFEPPFSLPLSPLHQSNIVDTTLTSEELVTDPEDDSEIDPRFDFCSPKMEKFPSEESMNLNDLSNNGNKSSVTTLETFNNEEESNTIVTDIIPSTPDELTTSEPEEDSGIDSRFDFCTLQNVGHPISSEDDSQKFLSQDSMNQNDIWDNGNKSSVTPLETFNNEETPESNMVIIPSTPEELATTEAEEDSEIDPRFDFCTLQTVGRPISTENDFQKSPSEESMNQNNIWNNGNKSSVTTLETVVDVIRNSEGTPFSSVSSFKMMPKYPPQEDYSSPILRRAFMEDHHQSFLPSESESEQACCASLRRGRSKGKKYPGSAPTAAASSTTKRGTLKERSLSLKQRLSNVFFKGPFN